MPKRILRGTVVSAKCDKTITVQVERRVKHPLYHKFIKRSKKFAAHDELNRFKEGDEVSIQECKPYSKSKTWKVIAEGAHEQPYVLEGKEVKNDSDANQPEGSR